MPFPTLSFAALPDVWLNSLAFQLIEFSSSSSSSILVYSMNLLRIHARQEQLLFFQLFVQIGYLLLGLSQICSRLIDHVIPFHPDSCVDRILLRILLLAAFQRYF
jgi:hypothetical protein